MASTAGSKGGIKNKKPKKTKKKNNFSFLVLNKSF